jgi:hypothetical protein
MNSWTQARVATIAIALMAMVVGASAIVFGAATGPRASAADITLGIDAKTDGNTANSLGTIDACTRVNVGDNFDVDLFVTDVTGLRGWDLYLGFDDTKIHVTAQTFLMVSGFDASDPVPDSLSPHYLGTGGSQTSGSGVLARVTFHADEPGQAVIAVSHDPLWPELNPGSDPIGDTSGDGYFDGPLIPASVAIGEDCGGPIVTDTPGPTITLPPTATPSATPGPTPAPPMQGDPDCSGAVNMQDAILTLNSAAKVRSGGNCSIRGDANCNGILDGEDVLRLLRYVALVPMQQPDNCAAIGAALS